MTAEAESKRLDLYNVLQEVLGNDPATTLMSHLQPVPAMDLVTKTEFEGFRAEFESFRIEMREFKTEMRVAMRDVNKRIDRVLLTVVAGQFVLLAGIVGVAIL